MGSRGDEKGGAFVREKSQTILSANWKLDVLLQKEKHMLDVSKMRTQHRIEMDEQITYKRFQTKLHHSKLCHARIAGNKEMLQKLLKKDSFDFTGGLSADDPLTLARQGEKTDLRNVESANARIIRAKEREMNAASARRLRLFELNSKIGSKEKNINDPLFVEDANPNTSNDHNDDTPPSLSVSCVEGDHRITSAKKERPGTAVERHMIKRGIKKKQSKTPISCTLQATETKKPRPVTATGLPSQPNDRKKTAEATKERSRPKTAVGVCQYIQEGVALVEHQQLIEVDEIINSHNQIDDNRTHKSNPQKLLPIPFRTLQTPEKENNIFTDKAKISLLEVHRELVKIANYDKKIKDFYTRIPPHLKLERNHLVDLYTALSNQVKHVKHLKTEDGISVHADRKEESEFDRLEYERNIGNINVTSMTFKSLKTDYSDVKNECIVSPVI